MTLKLHTHSLKFQVGDLLSSGLSSWRLCIVSSFFSDWSEEIRQNLKLSHSKTGSRSFSLDKMVCWVASGTLIFVLLFGASYSYPTNKGSDSGSQGGDSGGAQQVVYSKPGEYRGGDGSVGVAAAPVYPGYAASYPAGSMQGNTGPAASQDVKWLNKPHGPGYGSSEPGPRGTGPSAGQVESHSFHSHGSPQDGPSSLYQTGELSHMQNTFEHGNYDTESETQGLPVQQSNGVLPEGPNPVALDGDSSEQSFHPGSFNSYPSWDWRFLTGQYPPGLVSHFSSDFEQGRDYFHDAHYNKYYYDDSSGSEQQVKQFPKTKPGQQDGVTPQP